MKREISPSVLIAALLCVLGVLGYFIHRVFVVPPNYHGAAKDQTKRAKRVRTPYGYMSEEHAATLGFPSADANSAQNASGPGR